MPITTLVLMYATNQISSFIYASYFSAGLLGGLVTALSGVYLSQSNDPENNKELDMQIALNDVISLVQNSSTEEHEFDQKLVAYQHLLNSQTLAFFRKEFQLRHGSKGFNPSESTAFDAPRKKINSQQYSKG